MTTERLEIWIAVLAGALAIVREWRLARREQNEHLVEMRAMEEARFEQTARRDRRRRRDSSSPPPATRARPPQEVPLGEFDVTETTDIHELRELKRQELTPRGVRVPRRGTHHDKER